MQRFYFENLEEGDLSLVIKNPELLNQLNKVLRVKPGNRLAFFNGEDKKDYIFEVREVEKREVYLEKEGEKEVDSEIDFDLNVFQSLPNKLDKIEYILQKGVEVGVTGFYFFRSERSQKLILSPNKIERLGKIIVEAVEQSGRSRIPELIIDDNISLEDFSENENIIFHTDEKNSKSLKEIKLDYAKGINLFVGPEGGFSDEEVEIFENNSFKKVYLGNRILRCETTGVVAGFNIIQNK